MQQQGLLASAAVAAVGGILLSLRSRHESPSASLPLQPNQPETSDEDIDKPGLKNRLIRKAETVILGRTSRILLVVERCINDHNYSAIIRTAEALGIQHIWLVDPPDAATAEGASSSSPHQPSNDSNDTTAPPRNDEGVGSDFRMSEHALFARMATQWTTIRNFATTAECVAALRADNRTIWATDLGQQAVCLTSESLQQHLGVAADKLIPERLAIVFGTESVGCTEEILTAADMRVYLPLRGFADSLNLSVAAALCVQQLFHLCPEAAGQMDEEERTELRQAWFPKLAQHRITAGGIQKQQRKAQKQLSDLRHVIDKKARLGEEALTESQKNKLSREPAIRAELEQLEAGLRQAAEKIVADQVAQPPAPLRDMRRPDAHRTAFVGKSVKDKNQDVWKGMPAVANDPGGKHDQAIASS